MRSNLSNKWLKETSEMSMLVLWSGSSQPKESKLQCCRMTWQKYNTILLVSTRSLCSWRRSQHQAKTNYPTRLASSTTSNNSTKTSSTRSQNSSRSTLMCSRTICLVSLQSGSYWSSTTRNNVACSSSRMISSGRCLKSLSVSTTITKTSSTRRLRTRWRSGHV